MTGIVAFVSTVPASYVIGKKRGFIAKNHEIFDFYGLIIHKGRGKAVNLRLGLS